MLLRQHCPASLRRYWRWSDGAITNKIHILATIPACLALLHHAGVLCSPDRAAADCRWAVRHTADPHFADPRSFAGSAFWLSGRPAGWRPVALVWICLRGHGMLRIGIVVLGIRGQSERADSKQCQRCQRSEEFGNSYTYQFSLNGNEETDLDTSRAKEQGPCHAREKRACPFDRTRNLLSGFSLLLSSSIATVMQAMLPSLHSGFRCPRSGRSMFNTA